MLYEYYFDYYRAPLYIQRLRLQRDAELQTLVDDISPATVIEFDGNLIKRAATDPFYFTCEREAVREEYSNLIRNHTHYYRVFMRAFADVLSVDEQRYYKQFYGCNNDDVRFHEMNLRLQEHIIQLEKGSVNEWPIYYQSTV